MQRFIIQKKGKVKPKSLYKIRTVNYFTDIENKR